MQKIARHVTAHLDAGEIETTTGRAIVEERYRALRRQVPIVYLLALVNLFGIQVATEGRLVLGVNPPTALAICAVVRMVQWLGASKATLNPKEMLRRLRQTAWIAVAACALICVWCLQLLETDDPASRLAVTLFGSLTALGTAFGLSSYPTAARLPLLVLAIPLAVDALLSSHPGSIGAAISLSVVALLVMRLLHTHNSHFVDLIQSRALLSRERESTEKARSDAVIAATTDFLTGLPNRRALVSALELELSAATSGHRIGLALVDLDRFKPINDTFGHATGDEFLRVVASRLREAVADAGIVARLGGDEFAVLFPQLSKQSARQAGENLLKHLNRPATIQGRQFAVSASCGITVSRRGRLRDASSLLAQADVALYRAKLEAERLSIFEAGMEAVRRRRAQIERALQLPKVHENISLVYQPIFDLRTGRVIALEALARWFDDELGSVSPAEFVPLAEQLNVIGGLSDTLIRKAIDAAASWPNEIRLSFNLSAVQLCSDGSAKAILAALRNGSLDPHRLQVEVTETALLADYDKARANLAELREAGVSIALDDFGAGYASIAYLREMKFDQIKLDGSLVTSAQDCPERQRLLSAVVGLCQGLGVQSVAEHIETEEQLRFLLAVGCSAGQGYWLHRPITADATKGIGKLIGFLPSRNERSAA